MPEGSSAATGSSCPHVQPQGGGAGRKHILAPFLKGKVGVRAVGLGQQGQGRKELKMGRGSGCGKTHARQICRELGRRHEHDIHCEWEQGGQEQSSASLLKL